MNITEINKGIRALLLIGIMAFGYFIWNMLVTTAPTESQLWLNQNPIWKYLIMGTASISLFFSELAIIFPEINKKETAQ